MLSEIYKVSEKFWRFFLKKYMFSNCFAKIFKKNPLTVFLLLNSFFNFPCQFFFFSKISPLYFLYVFCKNFLPVSFFFLFYWCYFDLRNFLRFFTSRAKFFFDFSLKNLKIWKFFLIFLWKIWKSEIFKMMLV